MIFSKMNLAEVFLVQYLTGGASAHLVRYPVVMIMYLLWEWHVSGLIGPTKLISHSPHNGCKGSSSLKVEITVLENIASTFLSPKGIT